MSFKFVKVSSYYNDAIQDYYARFEYIVKKSYEEQYEHLMAQAFGYADFFSYHLRKLGVDAYEFVNNAKYLQEAWAKEKGSQATGRDLIFEQIKATAPEVVFFQDTSNFGKDFIQHLREKVPSIKLILGFCCYPFSKEQIKDFQFFDIMLGCSPQFVELFEKFNINSFEFNHSFEKSLLKQIHENNEFREIDFFMIGSFIQSSDFHRERIEIINRLIDAGININIRAQISNTNGMDVFAKQLIYQYVKFSNRLGLHSLNKQSSLLRKFLVLSEMPQKTKVSKKFKERIKPPLFGVDMYKALQKAKVGFNVHGGVAGDYAANCRLFEVTGVGTCLLTDYKKNIQEFFKPDEEVVTYASVDECVEKAKWLIDNPKLAEEIAQKGQQRTLTSHTVDIRAKQLYEIITKHLKKM